MIATVEIENSDSILKIVFGDDFASYFAELVKTKLDTQVEAHDVFFFDLSRFEAKSADTVKKEKIKDGMIGFINYAPIIRVTTSEHSVVAEAAGLRERGKPIPMRLISISHNKTARGNP